MAEPLGKEVVEFEATGLDEINIEVGKLEEAVKRAYAQQMALNQSMKDPAYQQRAAEVERLKRANAELANSTEKISEAERGRQENASRAGRLLSGEYRRQAGELATVRREAERLANAERRDDLRSGRSLSERLAEDRGSLRSRISDVRAQEQYRLSGGLASAARRTAVVSQAEHRERIAGRETMLQSGDYLRQREQSGRQAVHEAAMGLRERGAAMASGLLAKEVMLEGKLRGDIEKLALLERKNLLDSGVYLRVRERDAKLAGGAQAMGLRERGTALASGQFVRESMQARRLQQQADRLAMRERATLLVSGQFAAGVAHRETMASQEQMLSRAERKTELQVQHGRLLGGAMYGLERARPGMLAAGAVGAVGLGMARSGLSGTVEGNALAMEMHLLNRELAAAVLPAVKDLTSALRWVRQRTERMSGGQQDVLGYGTIAAGGIGAIGLAAGTISTAIGGISKMLGAVGLRAGGAAAASTVASQALASGVGTAAGNLAGGAASGVGAAAGSGRMAGLARLGPLAAIAYGAYHKFESGAVGQFANKPGIGSGLNMLADTPGSRSLGSAVSWGLTRLARPFVGKEAFDRMEERRRDIYEGRRDLLGRKTDAGRPHRTPMIAEAGFEDFDSAYQRTATAVALQDATEREPGGKLAANAENPAKESADSLKILVDLARQFLIPLR